MKLLIIFAIWVVLTGCQRQHLEIFPPLSSTDMMDKKIDPKLLHQDIDFLIEGARLRHPDLFKYANEKQLTSYVEQIKSQISEPLTRLEFYRHIGQLNHRFNDGHSMLLWPYPEYARLESTEQQPFPFKIALEPNGKVLLKHHYENDEGEVLAAGSEVTHINGKGIKHLLAQLQRYVGGETAYLRQQFIVGRFPLFLWAVTDMLDEFELGLQVDGKSVFKMVRVNQNWQVIKNEKTTEESFYYRQVNKDTGFLYVGHFDIEPSKFEDFVDGSFATINSQNIKNLIIDVRDNTGGNTDTVTYLARHLANKPFRLISRLTEKLNPDNRGLFNYKGEVGDMLTSAWEEWEEPVTEESRFKGKTFLLISPITYSAGIVFATTLKDNHFAILIGQETGGFANQTAQGNLFNLPHSELRAYITTRLLVRPSGDTEITGVKPHYQTAVSKQSLRQSRDVEVEKALELIADK